MVNNIFKDHKIIIICDMEAAEIVYKHGLTSAAKIELIRIEQEIDFPEIRQKIIQENLLSPIKITDIKLLKRVEVEDVHIEKSDNDFLNKKQKFQRRKAIKKLK